jgi:L-asparaginase II
MRAVPGLLLKSGAEGVEGFALDDGRAGAFKIDDGTARGRVPVTVGLLRHLGAEAEPGADRDALTALATGPVYGGGEIVGEIRATSFAAGRSAAGELGTRPVAGGLPGRLTAG